MTGFVVIIIQVEQITSAVANWEPLGRSRVLGPAEAIGFANRFASDACAPPTFSTLTVVAPALLDVLDRHPELTCPVETKLLNRPAKPLNVVRHALLHVCQN